MQIKKSIVSGLLIASFVSFMFMGIIMHTQMQMMPMKDCMVMQGEKTICNMGLTEQLMQWKQLATTNTKKISAIIIIYAILLTITIKPNTNPVFTIKKQRWKNKILLLFDTLRQALLNGTLRPTLYNCARI